MTQVTAVQPEAATDNAARDKFPKALGTKPSADTPASDSTAAEDVLRGYYAALEARDYQAAYALWSDEGKASNQRFEAFQAGFAETRSTSVSIEQPGEVEGAAGSLYVSIPVTVHAQLTDGSSQSFRGSYVLRRVNDVEGSTQEQRKWHLYSASLHAAK